MNYIDHLFERANNNKEQSYITTTEGFSSKLIDNRSDYAEEVDIFSRNNSILIVPTNNMNQSTEVTIIDFQNISYNSATESIEDKENRDPQTERNRYQDVNISKGRVSGYKNEEKKEGEKGKVKNVIKERANGAQIDITGVYVYKDSGIGDSYLIGTDEFEDQYRPTWANAFVGGIPACPEVLEIPGELTSKNGNTKPVEIIGSGAFCACTDIDDGGKTKSIKVPWQIKIINP